MTLIPRPGSVHSERKLGEAEARACAQLMEAYPSQRHIFRALAPAIEWALFTRYSLQYRELHPRPDHTVRPHAGPLFYEQTFPLSFEAFREKMRSLDAARSEGFEHHQEHDG